MQIVPILWYLSSSHWWRWHCYWSLVIVWVCWILPLSSDSVSRPLASDVSEQGCRSGTRNSPWPTWACGWRLLLRGSWQCLAVLDCSIYSWWFIHDSSLRNYEFQKNVTVFVTFIVTITRIMTEITWGREDLSWVLVQRVSICNVGALLVLWGLAAFSHCDLLERTANISFRACP